MNPPLAYPYASGNLLEQRNTYFYSTYEGPSFLDAWREQREQTLRDLSNAVPTVGKYDDALLSAPTDVLLESIHRDLCARRKFVQHQPLDRLVQRFEVSKRLHGEYDVAWHPVEPADYRSLERYVRFAEILALAYAQAGRLPYLNAMLKVVDTLSAVCSALSRDQRIRLEQIIVEERGYIEGLRARLIGGIDAP